ncbi:MAG: pyruvate formate lyase family protein, partial [Oscillospiraceae bacterium]|nr:pyruvate formate lyase family protein [Oscillospiraceae bacterium]
MAKLNVEIPQNAEISKKIPCEKPLLTQLEIMEQYTETHRRYTRDSKEAREIACLNVLYPTLFREIEDGDLLAGRIDFLPIGFGSVTSVGGVGHYCVFSKLRQFQADLPEAEKSRVDSLYEYWLTHDTKTIYCQDILTDTTIGAFIDCRYPMIATARLSGMMLDYQKLMDLGIGGLRSEILMHMETQPGNTLYPALLSCLDLFTSCAEHLRDMAKRHLLSATPVRRQALEQMIGSLEVVKHDKPQTFHQALQLFWLYALLAGCINYGRMDDVLGPFLARDLDAGRITEREAYDCIKSLWTMIENRRTTVNGRIIVGGRGRRNPREADIFLRIAMQVAHDCRYVEPQFTLRFDQNTPQDIMDMAMDCLGQGATYPTLYNDDVNIPAVMFGMRLDEQTAEQYVPFGCTEFVIQGQSTGTPNVCLNLLKLLTITLNEGIDPADGLHKAGSVCIPPISAFHTFEDLYTCYKTLLDYYIDLSIEAQIHSYKVMNGQVSFLFTSLLMDDCITRGKALLDGGVRYLGGTNETYGNINASDSLYAIKHLVYDTKKYTLQQIVDATTANFVAYETIRKDCL